MVRTVLFVVMTVLLAQIARLNLRFSLLPEALDAMQYRLFNFALVLFLSLTVLIVALSAFLWS